MDSTPNQMDPENSENLGFDIFCNTPTIDIEAPLSPVLSNSKQSIKYIARRKSRMRLLNKFSQNSTQSQIATQKSQINFDPISPKSFLTPEQNDLESFIINEYNSLINIETSQKNIKHLEEPTENNKNAINNLEYLNITNNNSDASLNDTSDVESKMRKIKDIQLSKKFLYKIPQNATITNINLKPPNEFQFKIPVSPVSSLKTKALIKENVFSKPKLNFEIGFETGGGKRIQLSERALQRAVKIFDDILDTPSDNFKPELNSPIKIYGTHLKVTQNDLKITENDLNHEKTSIKKSSHNLNNIPETSTSNNKIEETSIKKLSHNLNNIPETSTSNNKIEETSCKDLDELSNKPEIASSTSNMNNDNLLCSKRLTPESQITSKFTQISDTQMCWVAENTEHIMDCMNSQWTPSPQDKPLTHLDNIPETVKSLKDDFNDLSTQETDLYFGNISLASDGTLTARTTDLEPDFLGFEVDTNFKSLQTVDLYKRLIKYLTEDVKKKVFYPLSFTCSDIEHSMEYKNKNLKYSLRSRKTTKVTSCKKKARGIKKKTQENVKNTKRRTLNDDSKENILDRNKFKPNCSKTKCKEIVNISNKLKINPVNESKNTNILVNLPNDQSVLSTDESSNLSAPIFKNPCLGFSTASGLKIAISVGAVKKTKHLFDDCDFSENLSSETETLPPEPIFFTSTANSVSDDVLKKSKDIFIDPSQEQISTIERLTPEARFECLTASENSLQIPEDELKKARAIFVDSSEDELPSLEARIAFCASSEKQIQTERIISIFEDYQLSEDLSTNEMQTPGGTFGLSAVSGENVQIEESLNETRYLIEALDESVQLEDPLEKVKSDYRDISTGQIKSSASKLEFCTASGKCDQIMEESLKKNVFENCEMNEDFYTAKTNIVLSAAPSQKLINNMNEDFNLNNTLFKNFKVDFEDIFISAKEITLNPGIPERALVQTKSMLEEYDEFYKHFNKPALGFSSAAGKKITISDEALKKTRNIFEGCDVVDEENIDTTKNAGMVPSENHVNLSEDSSKKANLFQDCEEIEENFIKHRNISNNIAPFGFATASGKKVNISEDSLKKVKNLFDVCEITEEELKENCDTSRTVTNVGFATALGKKINISEDSFSEVTEKELNNFDIPKNEPTFGFATASGKKVNISEDCLKIVKNLFEDCEVTEEELTKNYDTPKNVADSGFATASEKKIIISEDSLKKVKSLFEDCEVTEQELTKNYDTPKTVPNFGFATASGKKVNISEDSLKKAKSLFEDCEVTEEELTKNYDTPKTGFGFATASGKKVNISEDSLKKAKSLFEDCEVTEEEITKNYDTPKTVANFGFATASGKKVDISEDSLKNAKSLFEDCEVTEEEITKNYDTPKTVANFGFATASGKKVNISEDSLKKVKSLFEDCEVTEEEITKNYDTPKTVANFGFATASGKKVNISEDSLKKVKSLFEDSEVTEEELTKNYDTRKNIAKLGFATVSGKKVNISEDSLEKVKSLFEDCEVTEEDLTKNFDSSKNMAKLGFNTASGKKVNISEDSLRKAKNLFEDCEVTEEILTTNYDTPKNMAKLGFATASGKKVNITEDSLKKAKSIFEDCEVTEEIFTTNYDTPKNLGKLGFATASGKKVNVPEDSLKKAKSIFEDCEVNEEELTKNYDTQKNVNIGFAAASGNDIIISEETLKKTKNVFEGCEFNEEIHYDISNNVANIGFATALGNKVNISEDSLKKARNIFEDCELPSEETSCKFDTPKNDKTSSTSSRKREVLKKSLKRVRNIFEEETANCEARQINKVHKFEDEVKTNSLPLKKVIPPFISPLLGSKSSPQIGESTPRNKSLNRSLKKRSLGVKSCRQFDIPETSIKRAKLVFEELETPKKTYNQSSTPNLSTSQSKIIPQFNSSIKETKPVPNTPKVSSVITTKTPTKRTIKEELQDNAPYLFHDPSNCDLKKLTVNFQKEYELLKLKMSVVENRMMMLKAQQMVIDNRSPEGVKQRPGHLYLKKSQNKNRITLKELVKHRRPSTSYEKSIYMGVSPSILEINPENASQLHFFVPWWPNDHRTYPAIIRTEDGAIIVPNQENQVGVSELDIAFRAMPGVEPKLIPNGWILNHYKWIIWKLASMERNYPDVFKDWLTIEHVVAQLKYRYDREIDKAQRPALRKIFECDDTAVKRMVLCVSKIIKHPDGKLDLELTDGWYSVKTQLDPPLNSLVYRGIITVGMKLMTQGSELINCEGCPPLEVPESVRLRIHFNSTRRAAWHLRLGYQPLPGPLCISLRTINNNGGPVGLTCAYIARVYPISYMERLEERSVWRSRKAEQRRSNEWESKQSHVMERVQQQVQQELEEEWNKKERELRGKGRVRGIKGVTCPKALFEFVEASNDQDSIREMLTSSQYEAVQNYQVQLSVKRQAELSDRLQQKLSKENIKPRNVSSVFKILLLDVNSIYHNKVLNIWRPTEDHLRDLKEGLVINIYNAIVRNNGQLSSSLRTQFVRDLDYDTEKFEPLDRTVLPIHQTKIPDSKPQFGEFDTVGLIISIEIQPTNQFLWMVDDNFKFLVIKIRESSETCCLFDSLVEGKVTAAINLVYQKPSKYGEALANHYTIFSSYPQPSYLQDYMKDFVDNLPEDLESYVAECKDQIDLFVSRKQFNNHIFPCDAKSQEMRNELCGVNKDVMTLSDEEMSLIDTQAM